MVIHKSPHPDVPLPDNTGVFDFVWTNPNGVPEDAVALTDGLSGTTLTRAELRKQCREFAYGLLNKKGLKRGETVCVFSPNSVWYYVFVLGCQCAGLVVSGANAAYVPEELAHQVGDSGARLILVNPMVLDVALSATRQLGWSKKEQKERIVLALPRRDAGPARENFLCFDQLMERGKEADAYTPKKPKEEVAYLGYSSGTSGKAKGVRTSYYNMTSVLSILTPFDVGPQDVHLAVLPLNHIYGLTKLLHWPILLGSPVVVMPKFEFSDFCTLIEKYKVTTVLLVPPIALALAKSDTSKWDLRSIKLLVSGAAPLGAELESALAKKLDCYVGQAYGLTESSPTTHFCPAKKPKPGSIGPLLPMMRGRICDPETLGDVKPGEQGEIWLQGPNIMLGYLNRPDADKETIVEDKEGRWLRTGDIGYVDEEGYYFITDRLKELIKVKGFQVAPADLEANLLGCDLVADCAVIGVYDNERATEFPRAYVVLSEAGKERNKDKVGEEIAKWIEERVSRAKRLQGGVRIVNMIPKSPSGKILRRILRVQASEEAAAATKAKL